MQLISKKIPIETVNVQDVFDISDVTLIDGVQKEYSRNVLYIGYYEQIGSKNLPSQCVLVRTNETSALKCTESNLALVERNNLFFLMNTAKSLVDASRSKGLYAELMDCAAQTKSITSVLNLAASKLGNSLILLGTDFKVLDFSKVYPIDDPLWNQNIKQGYCDYEFFDMLSTVKDASSLESFCHPALTLLKKYDHNKDTDLYHTLNVYLACGCSIKLTAEKLFIHRNSLSYRLKRIAELTQADLENSNTRFLLEMSYRIDHFTNGGTIS